MNIQTLIVRLNWKFCAAAHVVAAYKADPKFRLPWLWDQAIPNLKDLTWRYDRGTLMGLDVAWSLSDGRTVDLYTNLHSFEHTMDATIICGFLDKDPVYRKLPSMGMSKLYRSIIHAYS